MKHVASPQFWEHYAHLPGAIQHLADKNYALLKENFQHPSLHFKQIGRFWIGSHADYDRLIGRE